MPYFQSAKKGKLPLHMRIMQECKSSWWVVLFMIFTYMMYVKTLQGKDHDIAKLTEQFTEFEKNRSQAILVQESLVSEIASQQDPIWIEMMLIKKLGLIPEGYTKIRFTKEDAHFMSYVDGL